MIRRLIDYLYLNTAAMLPLRAASPQWMWDYVARARVYGEACEEDDFSGWPWRWRLARFDAETSP